MTAGTDAIQNDGKRLFKTAFAKSEFPDVCASCDIVFETENVAKPISEEISSCP